MRLVLEITSGPDAGRKMWLREGQVLEVGRTDLASFAVPHDPRLSGRHFAVRCDRSGCRLQDLDSRNGTLVNGNRVTEVTLRDGDIVVAGETRFVVKLEGAEAVPPPVPARTVAAPAPAIPRTAPAAVRSHAASATVAVQRFGIWLCRSVPANWVSEERGLRLPTTKAFPSSLILSDFPAPEDVPLDRFVHAQVEQFVQSLAGTEIEGPVPRKFEGADDGMQFTLRHPPQNGFILVQRYLYARRQNIFAMAILTTSSADLTNNAGEFEQLLASLAIEKSR